MLIHFDARNWKYYLIKILKHETISNDCCHFETPIIIDGLWHSGAAAHTHVCGHFVPPSYLIDFLTPGVDSYSNPSLKQTS